MLTRLLLLLGFSVLLTVALAYVIGFGFFLLGCLFPVKSAVRHLLMAFAPAEIQVDRIADPSLSDTEYALLERSTLSWENENRRVLSHFYHSASHCFDLILLGMRYRS